MTAASSPHRPRASVVIVCHGRRDMTERCLHSLRDALGPALGDTWEVVVVDNASPDDTLDLLRAWADRVTVVALPENRDFSGGCNAGAEAARGEVLVFLNNDTVVGPGALEALAEQVREPGVGAAGARLLYPDGTLQHAGVWMMREAEALVVPHHLFHHEPGDLPAAAVTVDLDCVTAACLAIPASLFAELGGFDTAYRNGWEDVDLCLRVRVAGHRVVYRGDVALVHDEGATRGRQQGMSRNAEIFYARWGAMLDDDREAFARIWDAAYTPPAAEGAGVADVRVHGQVSGLGPRAAQARAIVAGLEALGRRPGTRNAGLGAVGPRLTRDEWEPVRRALGRELPDGIPEIDPDAVPTAVLADAPQVGSGGGGTLALLPAHDLDAAAAALDAALALPGPLTVSPTVATDAVERLVAERAPHAERLGPGTSEAVLALRARAADAVVAADPADRWDRAALVCAGSGAAVVVRPGGPADALLGELAGTLGGRPAPVAGRAERHARVAEACAPARLLAAAVPAAT
ncbi:MAG: glycosyltransferase family 2 protein [Solirubrobacteraceae bacterium]|nr:glycosyltransferase family 2 protein [Solirubrobacteraceae bacterium]